MSPRHSRVQVWFNAALLAAGVCTGAALMPLTASAGTEVLTDSPPPPQRTEHAPPPRDGYVWAGGHWEWNRHSYVWVSGTWIVERRAARWVVDQWEQVGAQWHYVPGHWER